MTGAIHADSCLSAKIKVISAYLQKRVPELRTFPEQKAI
jgi:hypothetical protein